MILLLRNTLLVLGALPAFGASWTTFEDPREQAFTVEVPAGWAVQGGMFRMGYSDYRVMIDLKSPDGKISVRVGDVHIGTYAAPNAQHPEGSNVDLGAQAQLTVARYRTGKEYAPLYAKVRFKECRSLTPATVTAAPPVPDTPELAEVKQATIGEAEYTCDGSREAYVYAKTANYGGMWQVHALWSYLAPADGVLSARAILGHAAKTFKLSEAWVAHQKELDRQAMVYQRQRQQARMRELSVQQARFEMRMQQMRKQAESFDRVLRGVTATVDPLGNGHEVSTGPLNGYWTDGVGHYVNSNRSPGPGWQELQTLP